MEQSQLILSGFFRAIEHDPRVGVSHISLYCAILQFGTENSEKGAVLIISYEVMKTAKIAGVGTYHKCIRDLHAFGYIKYVPSFDHRRKSKVYFLNK